LSPFQATLFPWHLRTQQNIFLPKHDVLFLIFQVAITRLGTFQAQIRLPFHLTLATSFLDLFYKDS